MCSATTSSRDDGHWNETKTWKQGKIPTSIDQVFLRSGTDVSILETTASDTIEFSGPETTRLFITGNLVIGGDGDTCGPTTCDLKEVRGYHRIVTLCLLTHGVSLTFLPTISQLKLGTGLEAVVYGGFVRNVQANAFMPGL